MTITHTAERATPSPATLHRITAGTTFDHRRSFGTATPISFCRPFTTRSSKCCATLKFLPRNLEGPTQQHIETSASWPNFSHQNSPRWEPRPDGSIPKSSRQPMPFWFGSNPSQRLSSHLLDTIAIHHRIILCSGLYCSAARQNCQKSFHWPWHFCSASCYKS